MKNETDDVGLLAEALYGGADGSREALEAAIAAVGNVTGADLRRALKFVVEQEGANAHTQLQFTILGTPPTAKRPRASRMKNKAGEVVGIRMHAADAGDQASIREAVTRRLPAGFVPFAGEVELALEVYRPMLASWSPYKQLLAELGYLRVDRKPDWDNSAKLVTDAMRGVVFVDDSLVVFGSVTMQYSRRPRLEVTVSGRARSITR